jgi:DNA-directed RNA polymerase specialized sigma24 family protein
MVKDNAALERGLWDVREGRKTFDEFARETRAVWESLAKYVLRRWRVAAWADQEDAVQDLLLGAWTAIYDYDPRHPAAPTLAAYVTYGAVDKAKKRAHKYRGAILSGDADRNPSRIQKCATQLWGEDAARRMEEASVVEAPQGDDVEQAMAVEAALEGSATVAERRALEAALRLGDFAGFLAGDDETLALAGAALYDDEESRRACGVRTRREAVRVAVLASQSAAARLLAAAA